MSASNAPQEDILQKFTREYRESIPEKEKVIRDLLDEMKKEITLDHLKALKMHVHKIAGSAGTYGFPEVSKRCHQFELELIEKIEHLTERPQAPSWLAEFETHFSAIKEGFSHVSPKL